MQLIDLGTIKRSKECLESSSGQLDEKDKHYLSAMPPYSQRVYWSVVQEALRVICYVLEVFIALPFCQLKKELDQNNENTK